MPEDRVMRRLQILKDLVGVQCKVPRQPHSRAGQERGGQHEGQVFPDLPTVSPGMQNSLDGGCRRLEWQQRL